MLSPISGLLSPYIAWRLRAPPITVTRGLTSRMGRRGVTRFRDVDHCVALARDRSAPSLSELKIGHARGH